MPRRAALHSIDSGWPSLAASARNVICSALQYGVEYANESPFLGMFWNF